MHISISELKRKMIHTSLNLIDIRQYNQFQEGTIPFSKHIDEISLWNYAEKFLNKKEEYYLFCNNGHRSFKLSSYLNSLGYQVYSIDGGYHQYLLEK